MRVVQDSAKPAGDRRRGDAPVVTIDNAAAGNLPAPGAGVAAKKGGLPLLQAALFLLACALGGVAIAFIRPFGLG